MNLLKRLPLPLGSFHKTRAVVGTHLQLLVARKLTSNVTADFMPEAVDISVSTEGKRLQAAWGTEASPASTYHSVWLRYNCQCSQCLTSYNQNAVIPTDLNPRVTITEARITGNLTNKLFMSTSLPLCTRAPVVIAIATVISRWLWSAFTYATPGRLNRNLRRRGEIVSRGHAYDFSWPRY